MSLSALVMAGVALLFCVFVVCPKPVNAVQTLPVLGVTPAAETHVSVWDASSFNDLGLYICRPAKPVAGNVYFGTISTDDIINSAGSFWPTFCAAVRHDDQWEPITDNDPDFWFEPIDDMHSVR